MAEKFLAEQPKDTEYFLRQIEAANAALFGLYAQLRQVRMEEPTDESYERAHGIRVGITNALNSFAYAHMNYASAKAAENVAGSQSAEPDLAPWMQVIRESIGRGTGTF